ncbi:hypothetical protein CY34DRAFT_657277 [Suillus luteus UH-Slu-Lm8-n1]|uniref:Uncharacterized protein n=1 Tax=Suillus luteus UH-Slu-Lm8-n1 TaxID=930992 RepID=A0A0D0BCT7_9AGAM|nr:hypothetical protein CY34DRAFT_657277 [Suillus luteus UH-Slu-Lm8-n1]
MSTIAIPEGAHTIIPIRAASRHKVMWGTDANERSAQWFLSIITAPSQAQEVNCSLDREDAASTMKNEGKNRYRKSYLNIYSN